MSYTPTNWANLPSTTSPINKNNLQNMEDELKTLDNVIDVNNYNSTSTYSIGDFCIYNKKLHRCTVAITTAENFNSSHWVQTSLKNEINRKEVTTKNFTGSTTATANSGVGLTINMTYSGYKLLGIVQIDYDGYNLGIDKYGIYVSNNQDMAYVELRNLTSSSINFTYNISGLYVKS